MILQKTFPDQNYFSSDTLISSMFLALALIGWLRPTYSLSGFTTYNLLTLTIGNANIIWHNVASRTWHHLLLSLVSVLLLPAWDISQHFDDSYSTLIDPLYGMTVWKDLRYPSGLRKSMPPCSFHFRSVDVNQNLSDPPFGSPPLNWPRTSPPTPHPSTVNRATKAAITASLNHLQSDS